LSSSGTASDRGAAAGEVSYRQALPEDLPAVARLFLRAFPESVAHYARGPVKPDSMEDAFAVCLDAEPGAFQLALVGGTVVGYIFAPLYLPALFSTALRRGHLLRMAGRYLTGKYGIGLRPVLVAGLNFWHLWREALQPRLRCDARVFSVAVDPALQGRGLGSGLLRQALAYLRGRGARCVRLEVRPDNTPAVRAYERAGFAVRGRTRDTQGEWLVMLMELG
jgi:[ribosomal protein S18]-alanine N-acetyltransferase